MTQIKPKLKLIGLALATISAMAVSQSAGTHSGFTHTSGLVAAFSAPR